MAAPNSILHASGNAPTPWWRGWLPLIVLPPVAWALTASAGPRWAMMWAVAGAILLGCKWLTWRRTPVPGASWRRQVGYLLGWPGMDAAVFLAQRAPEAVPHPTRGEWVSAALRTASGTLLIWTGVRAAHDLPALVQGWIGMVGLIMVLHFGVLHLLSCAWRQADVAARPLMDRPLAATSLAAFWGRQWNTAFRDLTHRFLFRPLRGRLGAQPALIAGFLLSGLIHEVVITVPARGGYGLPTAYFLIQAAGIAVERSRVGRNLALGSGWMGRLFTMLVLIAPVGLLFPPPFVRNVILPFLSAIGAR